PADSVEGPWLQTVHAEGDARNCAVFPWIPGVRLEDVPAEQRTRALIETFGEFLAKMHNASEQFEAPPWFDRHRYGAEEFRRDMAANLAEEDFPAESERELREAGLRRLQLMEELGEGKDVFGLVQPDLSARNVLANGGDIACVDFYELGYGHYLMDLVQALHRTVNEGEREAVLDGYQRARPLPDRFEERRKIIREARAFPRGWWMVS
ncbi:phosphotransferase, partial [Candidatus Poribacteria bacterium]|nr:phosphotransferase [Candidatus Poribacteria bacterium]